MKRNLLVLFAFVLAISSLYAQDISTDEIGVGLRFQKSEQFYWENGVSLDYTSSFLLNKRLHLELSYVSSGLGTALEGNSLLQDNLTVSVNWHFFSSKGLQLVTGLNTGFFHVDLPTPLFDALPKNSMLFSAEAGLYYRFKFPLAASLSAGYNFINGNGVNVPGSLFPVYYQLSVFYTIGGN